MKFYPLISFLFFLLFFSFAFSQKKDKQIKLVHANSLEYDDAQSQAKRLIGNVVLKHEKATMYCDSAYLYSDSNIMDAYGHISIKKGRTSISGDSMHYDGNTKMAQFRQNVKMIDKEMILTTNYLDYNVQTDYAFYKGGGKIVFTKDDNTLTSRYGYNNGNDEFFFKDYVVIINPEYEIYSDTLKYITKTTISHFFGPTFIRSKSKVIYCENGWYDNEHNIAQFKKNAYMIDGSNKLLADSIYYDSKKKIGKAYGHVSMIDTSQNIEISGDNAIHLEQDSTSIFTGNTLFTQIYEKDSLFLHADTLLATYNKSNGEQIMYAFHKVRFFKSDLQGKCDSLVYSQADSSIQLFSDPVLWADENQMTAASMEIRSYDGKIQSLIMLKNAFIISEEDSVRFNQIKGKDMFGYFHENKLQKIDVMGNGQTIYFAKEEEDSVYIGVNKAECSDLSIYINDNQVEKISFLNKPIATIYPIEDMATYDLILRDFSWKGNIRPKRKEDIFIWK